MKLDARAVPGFLGDPRGCRVVLLYGEDPGLVRERAEAVVRAIVGSLNDPFRVVDLDRDGFKRIAEEMAARSLMGGRLVVRVREAAESIAGAVQGVLDTQGDNLLVLESGTLTGRSRLRLLIEQAKLGVSIACYKESGQALEQTIRSILAAEDVRVDHEALHFLADQLGADRSSTRAEIEKLALFSGPGGMVDRETAGAVIGDMAGLQLDDALFAATAGDVAATDRALEVAMAEGLAPVAALRTALGHLQRLHRVRAEIDLGSSAADAMAGLRPPLFGRRSSAFAQALRLWSSAGLAAACQGVWEAELGCKRTGSPAETLCRNAVLGIARRAKARSH